MQILCTERAKQIHDHPNSQARNLKIAGSNPDPATNKGSVEERPQPIDGKAIYGVGVFAASGNPSTWVTFGFSVSKKTVFKRLGMWP